MTYLNLVGDIRKKQLGLIANELPIPWNQRAESTDTGQSIFECGIIAHVDKVKNLSFSRVGEISFEKKFENNGLLKIRVNSDKEFIEKENLMYKVRQNVRDKSKR
jgi:hypothetical protein